MRWLCSVQERGSAHMPVENASSRPTGGLRAAPLSCQPRFSDKIGVTSQDINTVDGEKQSIASE